MNKVQEITVYDIDKYIQKKSDGEYKVHRENEITIMEFPYGVIVTGIEGVHEIKNLVTDSIKIELAKINRKTPNSIPLIPHALSAIPLKEFMDNCSSRKDTLGNFIRKFGSRLETNYRIMLDSIKEVGGDPDLFPRK